MSVKLCYKRVRDAGGIVAPNNGNAGYDLMAAEQVLLPAFGRAIVPTGVALELPDGYMARVSSRSGLAFGKNPVPPTTPHGMVIPLEQAHSVVAFHGTIDANYRGELMVLLFNFSPYAVDVRCNARIAQLVLVKVETPELALVEELGESTRGDRGFGSSGF